MSRRKWGVVFGVGVTVTWLTAAVPAWRSAGGEGRDETLRELKKELRASFPDRRRSAVRGLAELGTPDAWGYVLGALEDPEPEVADEAQLVLAGVDEERALAGLLGKQGLLAGDDWVRLRVAEALGRVDLPVEAGELTRPLAARDATLVRTLLWSVERLARRERLTGRVDRLADAARRCSKGRDPGVRAAALSARAALGIEDRGALVEDGFSDRDPAVRCGALAVAAELEPATGLRFARVASSDDAPSVRLAAVELLEALAVREAAAVLVDRLGAEPRARVRWRVVAALQRLSGFKYQLDPRPWRRWLEGVGDDFRSAKAVPEAAVGPRTVAFAGLPILSDRVCFLVDFSGSLWVRRESGRTRKEILDERVRAVLEALPEETEFNLVPYTNDPIPWQPKLVPARRPLVVQGVRFFEKCSATGKGNFFDAALLALADPRVDTIVALTDGAPTGGHRWNLDLMVELLAEENRYRKVAFDSILVDASPHLQRSWAELARRTAGRSIAVALE